LAQGDDTREPWTCYEEQKKSNSMGQRTATEVQVVTITIHLLAASLDTVLFIVLDPKSGNHWFFLPENFGLRTELQGNLTSFVPVLRTLSENKAPKI
jgi:hypothetical protein